MDITFSAIAHVIYRRATFSEHLSARLPRREHGNAGSICLHRRVPPIPREVTGCLRTRPIISAVMGKIALGYLGLQHICQIRTVI